MLHSISNFTPDTENVILIQEIGDLNHISIMICGILIVLLIKIEMLILWSIWFVQSKISSSRYKRSASRFLE
jgi:hypothetical protein